jgi:hypothetical protein
VVKFQLLSNLLQKYDADPPLLGKFPEAVRIFRNPVVGGVILAYFITVMIWPGGFDAQLYYLRWPPPTATTPYWVYLLTYPLSLLGWPLSWQVLVALTATAAVLIYSLRGNRRWWIVLFCSPLIFNNWWGQVEICTIIGIAVGLSLLNKKIPGVWIAAVWLLLGIKIQTNYGLILLFSFWFWRQRGLKAFVPGMLASAAIVGLTLLIWPHWPSRLVSVYKSTTFGFANASLWPFGNLAWLPAILPIRMSAEKRLRLTAAASLLGTPYFTLHHCMGLMVLSDYIWQFPLSWLPMIMIFQTRDWSMYAWIIPLVILVYECAGIWRSRRSMGFPTSETISRSGPGIPLPNPH